jgi:hypothetical protein
MSVPAHYALFGLVSVVFVYKSSVNMAALFSNCTVVEQPVVTHSWE